MGGGFIKLSTRAGEVLRYGVGRRGKGQQREEETVRDGERERKRERERQRERARERKSREEIRATPAGDQRGSEEKFDKQSLKNS